MGNPIDPTTPGTWHEFITDGSEAWRGLLKADLTAVGILKVEAGRPAKRLSKAALDAEAERHAAIMAARDGDADANAALQALLDATASERHRSVHDTPRHGSLPSTVRVLYSAAPFSPSAQRRALEQYGVWPAGSPVG